MKLYNLSAAEFKKLRPNDFTISVFGLGKMGLPLAATFAKYNFKVIGVDINKQTINLINKGQNPVKYERGLGILVKKAVQKGLLKATTDSVQASLQSDVKVIIIPIYLDTKNTPNLTILEEVVKKIAQGLQKGDIVILESTAPPGTTINVIGRMLESLTGLKLNEDFGVAHCPERISSQTAIEDIEGRLCPKIIGGSNKKTVRAVQFIYQKINKRGVIRVQNPTVAELVKIWGEIYRDVNIAFANDLYLSCRQMGVDALEVINASNTNPYSKILLPGPGVGGHCIPVYPYFILNENSKNNEILKISRKINDSMSSHVIELVKEAFEENKKSLAKANILILGIAYRNGVKETRKSPGIKIAQELKEKNVNVFVYDPLFDKKEVKSLGLKYKKDFSNIDCIVIATAEDEFKKMNWQKVGKQLKTKIVIDTRNTINANKLDKLKFTVRRIGYAN